jgi:hypothetical protein
VSWLPGRGLYDENCLMVTDILERAPSRHAGVRATRPWGCWGDGLAVALAALLVGAPALLTRDGFMLDFTNHLWLVWQQQHAISTDLAPTYFVSAGGVGIFYPFFMFYGGTLYAAAGAAGAVLAGHVVAAYVGAILLATAAAYGGLLWLARQLGVKTWMAHAPALAFTTSAIYISNLYGYGGWTEFIATSMIPLLLASGCKLARAPRIELVPAALFVLATVIFAGSHNVTLLLGTASSLAGIALLRLAVGRQLWRVGRKRSGGIAALFLLAVAVNAWFLLPDLWFAADTAVAHHGTHGWSYSGLLNTPGVVFDPLRSVPTKWNLHAFYVQAPDWFLGWAIGAGVVLWSAMPGHLRRASVALIILLALLLCPRLIGPVWDAIPLSGIVQFPYRLDTFVALGAAALVLVVVLAIDGRSQGRARRWLTVLLGGASIISLALCIWQLWVPDTHGAFFGARSYSNRDRALVYLHRLPHSFFAWSDYNDYSARIVATHGRRLTINPARIAGDHVTLDVYPPRGPAPFATNIVGGPYAAHLGGGIVAIGRTRGGRVVARRADSRSRGPVRISIGSAGGPVTAGRTITLLSIAILVILPAVAVWRRKRSGPSGPGVSVARDG